MYIETENGERIDFNDYDDPVVKPGEGSLWELVVVHKEGGNGFCIATFEDVNHANRAEESLGVAIGSDRAWSAKEFKDNPFGLPCPSHFKVVGPSRGNIVDLLRFINAFLNVGKIL